MDYGIETDIQGRVKAPVQCLYPHQTSNPNVIAGGDRVRGSDLVVTAIFEGRQAAEGIMRYLDVGFSGVRLPDSALSKQSLT